MQEETNEVYFALMSESGVRVAFNDFNKGLLKLYKNVETPYIMSFSPDIPFNTVFAKESRHFAMIGISNTIADYSTSIGGMFGYIMETEDSKRQHSIIERTPIDIPWYTLGIESTYGFDDAIRSDFSYVLSDDGMM